MVTFLQPALIKKKLLTFKRGHHPLFLVVLVSVTSIHTIASILGKVMCGSPIIIIGVFTKDSRSGSESNIDVSTSSFVRTSTWISSGTKTPSSPSRFLKIIFNSKNTGIHFRYCGYEKGKSASTYFYFFPNVLSFCLF